jgi:hypothetical protein
VCDQVGRPCPPDDQNENHAVEGFRRSLTILIPRQPPASNRDNGGRSTGGPVLHRHHEPFDIREIQPVPSWDLGEYGLFVGVRVECQLRQAGSLIGVLGRLSWCEGYTDKVDHAEAFSVDDLDHELDRLTARAAQLGTAFNVTLAGSDGTSMEIVVGAPVASVQWMRDEPWCCLVSVTDDVARSDDLIPFAGNGQYSELPRRYWIEVAAAREAVRHYLRTGQLPPLMRWEQF